MAGHFLCYLLFEPDLLAFLMADAKVETGRFQENDRQADF
jgi:hypothetical protein